MLWMFNATSRPLTKSNQILRLSTNEMLAALASSLNPRVKRQGYLAEFFRCTAHQPEALLSFLEFTGHLKNALPNTLTDIVALCVYRADGQRLRAGPARAALAAARFGEEWLREVLSLVADGPGIISEKEGLA